MIFAVIRSNSLSSLEMLYFPFGTLGIVEWKWRVGKKKSRWGEIEGEIIITYIHEMGLGFDE